MAIMNHEGEIEQIGTPQEIYELPHSSFVAKFVGSTNLFSGTLANIEQDTNLTVPHLGTFACFLPGKKPWVYEQAEVALSLRPEKIQIHKARQEAFDNTLEGIVTQIVYYGRSTQYTVLVNNQFPIQVFEQNQRGLDDNIDYDDSVFLHWNRVSGVLLER